MWRTAVTFCEQQKSGVTHMAGMGARAPELQISRAERDHRLSRSAVGVSYFLAHILLQ